MTHKQTRFCAEYLIDFNGSQAAIRAGYSPKAAKETGSYLLTLPNIKAIIAENQVAVMEKTGLDHAWVLQQFQTIAQRCMQAEPVMKFDKVDKVMVQASETNDAGEEVPLFTFDSAGANKAIEMIGKHLGFFEKDNEQAKAVVNLLNAPVIFK